MIKIFSVKIVHKVDENPDTSFLGEYTDRPDEWVIVRKSGEYLAELGEDYELPPPGREFRFFKPYAGGEKEGTEDYKKYGLQDYERMEGLSRGDWSFIGTRAVASVGISTDGGRSWTTQKIHSGGIWGIESDSAADHIESEEKGQLAELADLLIELGCGRDEVEAHMKLCEAA